ncbi:hypothetical protein N8A90_14400 [Variovorax sp. N23]|nr:hypothetical protein [Variovorax sp. N23]
MSAGSAAGRHCRATGIKKVQSFGRLAQRRHKKGKVSDELKVKDFDGVTANLVAPGAIAVDCMRQRRADQAETEGMSEAVVLQRCVQSLGVALQRTNDTADVVAAARLLAGKGGRNITGQEIVVGGA